MENIVNNENYNESEIHNILPPLYFPQRGKILKFYINNKISLSLWERDQG